MKMIDTAPFIYRQRQYQDHCRQQIIDAKKSADMMFERDKNELLKRIANAEKDIVDVKSKGIKRPNEICLAFNYGSIMTTDCKLCGKYINLDHYKYILIGDPNPTMPLFGQPMLCMDCAYKYAPYISCGLIPYLEIEKNYKFFQDLRKTHAHIIEPAYESRVPEIMLFLHKANKMKAFL